MALITTTSANSYPLNKHQTFKNKYGEGRRLEYGLDYIKAMPQEWTDEQRWAMMVELYDDLIGLHRKGICTGCGEIGTVFCSWCEDGCE